MNPVAILRIISTSVFILGCASEVKRTKLSDPTLTIILDDKGLEPSDYIAVQESLFATGKFKILDRSKAYDAIRAEQMREHRLESDKFNDSEKYAQWGRFIGAGGVVTASYECKGAESNQNLIYLAAHLSTLGIFDKIICTQFIQLTDTSTGQVVASIKYDGKKGANEVLDWSDAANKLVDQYPDTFVTLEKHQKLIDYEVESLRIAREQRQKLNETQLALEAQAKKANDEAYKVAYQKECGEYHAKMDAISAEADGLKQKAYRYLQSVTDSSEIPILEKKLKKEGSDIELKLYKLGLDPKYKNCDGNLSKSVNPEFRSPANDDN